MNISLWEEDFDEYFIGEVDLKQIDKIQEELKLVLPSSYVELMKQRNGFYLIKKYFPTTESNSWANNSVYVDFLFGIGANPGILDSIYLRKEWGIRSHKLLIISADPPIFICLDYRSKKTPSVIFIDVEQSQEITLAKNFEEFISGLVDYIEEEHISYKDVLSEQEVKDYYIKIDDLMLKGKTKEIDNLFTKVLSTNNELIRYMVEKMKNHEKPKVHFDLLRVLSECAEGFNKEMIEDQHLLEILNELSESRNRDVKELVEYSLQHLNKRLNI